MASAAAAAAAAALDALVDLFVALVGLLLLLPPVAFDGWNMFGVPSPKYMVGVQVRFTVVVFACLIRVRVFDVKV